MDWSAIGTIVALLGVAVTFIFALRGQRQERELASRDAGRAERAQRAAEASAERSENASRLTIDTLTRIAVALEGAASVGLGAGRALPSASVAWTLENFGGDTYILKNVGDAVAYSVEISVHESLLRGGEWPQAQDLKPSEALTFMAMRMLGTSDSTVTVEWSIDPEAGASRENWRYPLPPRPQR